MNTFCIDVKSGVQAFAFKDELLAAGLVWPTDFRWNYHPSNTDWDYENNRSAWVEFEFADPQLATYYKLKWL